MPNYMQIFPIDRTTVNAASGQWKARVTNIPDPQTTSDPNKYGDAVCYIIELTPPSGPGVRQLKLWASNVGLHHDADGNHRRRLFDVVRLWIDTESGDGDVDCF